MAKMTSSLGAYKPQSRKNNVPIQINFSHTNVTKPLTGSRCNIATTRRFKLLMIL